MAPDHSRLDPVELEQLKGLGVVASRDLDLVAVLAEEGDQGPEDEHVRAGSHVDPDAHGLSGHRSACDACGTAESQTRNGFAAKLIAGG